MVPGSIQPHLNINYHAQTHSIYDTFQDVLDNVEMSPWLVEQTTWHLLKRRCNPGLNDRIIAEGLISERLSIAQCMASDSML